MKEVKSLSLKNKFIAGDLLYSKLRPYLNKVAIAPKDGYCSSEILPINLSPNLDINYFHCLLLGPYFANYAKRNSYGVKMPRFGTDAGRQALIPLPPLAEQKRIAARLDEILGHIAAYKQTPSELAQLGAACKKSILQYAIQGKLVPQDPNDEPASVLLEKIRKERAKLLQQGKIKKPKTESRIFRRNGSWWEKTGNAEKCIDEEIPFAVPESWEWVRLGNICGLLSGQDLTPDLYSATATGTPYITGASNIHDERIIVNRWTATPRNIAKKGDLLFVCKGSVGKFAFLEEEEAHIARQIMAVRNLYDLNFDYIGYVIQNHVFAIQKDAQGIIPGIAREALLAKLIPLPPLAEQKRIAAKIAEFMAMERRLAQALAS